MLGADQTAARVDRGTTLKERSMAERVTTSNEMTWMLSFPIPGALARDLRDPSWVRTAVGQLSRREREILPLLAARWTDREIAEALCISYRTVTTHVTHIYNKLGVGSRREAAALAILAFE
jgi:DNA-binding NarL/FixJ family response regulator